MDSQPWIFRTSAPTPFRNSRVSSFRKAASLATVACAAVLLSGSAVGAQQPVRPQIATPAQRKLSFRAVSYDVYASILPATQSITAKATVEFESLDPSRIIECELHPNLRITAVRDTKGQVLEVDRDDYNPLVLRVTLPDPVPTGQRFKLTFEYAGLLANEEQSPVPGVAMAKVTADNAYLLLPARWFPLTNFPSNRYTGTFHIEVPPGFTVAGTGTTVAPSVAVAPAAKLAGPPTPAAGASSAGRMVYTFHADRPEAAGTFVAGALQLTTAKGEGLTIPVYAPASASATAPAYGQHAAHIVEVYSDQFGPLPEPNLTVAQLPDGTLPSYSAPGLLLISQRQWTANTNENLLANLVAGQWWGNQVMAASASDQWITDGLARYSEALYVEDATGKNGMDKLIDEFAIGSMMYEGPTTISDAGRLPPFSPDYNSVVVNKGRAGV